MEYLAAHQTEILLAVLATIAGGMIRGFSGFGPSLIMAPVLSFLLGPAQAVATIVLTNFPATLIQLPGAYKTAKWREMVPLGIAQSITIPVGTYLLIIVDAETMRRVISALVVVAAISIWRGWRYRGPRNIRASMTVGAFAGLVTGSTTLGGPPVALYMLSSSYSPQIIRASFIGLFSIVQISAVTSLLVAGLITEETLWRASVAAPAFLVGLWLGGQLFKRVDEKAYRRGILLLLIVISTIILIT